MSASNFLSPGVYFKETDLTLTTAGVSTSVGAFAGEFVWGPTNIPTLIENESQLVTYFGKPTDSTYASFFSAKNFLDYSTALRLVRVGVAGHKNAVATGTAVLVQNDDAYTSTHSNGIASIGMTLAKYPGAIGNGLSVSFCDSNTFSVSGTDAAGTVAITKDSAVVTGTSTAFDVKCTTGSYITITIGGVAVTKKIVSVTSATSLTVDSVFTQNSDTGLTYSLKWEFASLFDSAPVDSDSAVAIGASKDGLHMVVVDTLGKFSGNTNTVLSKYPNVSKYASAVSYDGTSLYYKNVLNSDPYVWWAAHPLDTDTVADANAIVWGSSVATGKAFKLLKKPVTNVLSNGSDGSTATNGEIQSAFDLFKEAESLDISLLITGKVAPAVQQYVAQSIADYRKDCVAFVSACDSTGAPIVGSDSATLQDILDWKNTDFNVGSTYTVCDSGFKYQYDKYNDVYRWIPLNADVAGCCARTDYVAESWYSPAGTARGQIKNATKLSYNPSKTARDELFKISINPVVSFPGEGTVLFGDKTSTNRPSAFDAINVRRLFLFIEKSLAKMSRSFLFEQNTELTRKLFESNISSLLRDVRGRNGITDFYVDVGPTVNTGDVIDANELRANIYIKPTRAIRFIALNFIATKTSASFTEIAA